MAKRTSSKINKTLVVYECYVIFKTEFINLRIVTTTLIYYSLFFENYSTVFYFLL